MQLVADNPDIPDVLLQALEEGRVVFFCGAGISYPVGLSGFNWRGKTGVPQLLQDVTEQARTLARSAG